MEYYDDSKWKKLSNFLKGLITFIEEEVWCLFLNLLFIIESLENSCTVCISFNYFRE
jgi:hypothetical protein